MDAENTEDLVVTLEQARDYLGIDFEDDVTDRRLTSAIKASGYFIAGAVGDNYPKDDPRVTEVALMLIGDIYDSRQLSQKETSAFRNLATNMLLQLRLEMSVKEV